MEKTVFGMDMAEVSRLKKEVLAWKDSNHPHIKCEGDGFRVAFTEGAELLLKDQEAVRVFAKVHD